MRVSGKHFLKDHVRHKTIFAISMINIFLIWRKIKFHSQWRLIYKNQICGVITEFTAYRFIAYSIDLIVFKLIVMGR